MTTQNKGEGWKTIYKIKIDYLKPLGQPSVKVLETIIPKKKEKKHALLKSPYQYHKVLALMQHLEIVAIGVIWLQ